MFANPGQLFPSVGTQPLIPIFENRLSVYNAEENWIENYATE
jgi:hypothetical protein